MAPRGSRLLHIGGDPRGDGIEAAAAAAALREGGAIESGPAGNTRRDTTGKEPQDVIRGSKGAGVGERPHSSPAVVHQLLVADRLIVQGMNVLPKPPVLTLSTSCQMAS